MTRGLVELVLADEARRRGLDHVARGRRHAAAARAELDRAAAELAIAPSRTWTERLGRDTVVEHGRGARRPRRPHGAPLVPPRR